MGTHAFFIVIEPGKGGRERQGSLVRAGLFVLFLFLRTGVTKVLIKSVRKDAREQGSVDESSERRKESIATFHKNRASNQADRFWGHDSR